MPRRASFITLIENDHPSFDDYLNMAFEANPDLPTNELPPFAIFLPIMNESRIRQIHSLRMGGEVAIEHARLALGVMAVYGQGGTYIKVVDDWVQAVARRYMYRVRVRIEQDVEDAIEREAIRFKNDLSTMKAMLPDREEEVTRDLSESLGSQDTESDTD